MRMTNYSKLIASWVLCGMSYSIFAEPPDTILRQLATSERDEGAEVYWIDSDVNGDGINDLIVTTTKYQHEEDRRDFEWLVFSGQEGGTYIRCNTVRGGAPQSLLSMRLDRCWIGFIPELKQFGLLYMVSGTGGQATCQIIALILKGASFTEVPLGEPVNAEENFVSLNQRLLGPGRPVTRKASVAEVKKHAGTIQAGPEMPASVPGSVQKPSIRRDPALVPNIESRSPADVRSAFASAYWLKATGVMVAAIGLLWLVIKKRRTF